MIQAFLLDDEPLAVRKLARMLEETGRVEIVGQSTDPVEALGQLEKHTLDVLFLDIHMPGLTGFELLSKLDPQPLVVFTTAWDQYALQAFEVNSVDYLLKPIHERQVFGQSVLLFDGVERKQLSELGEVRTPSVADVFVAMMTSVRN